MQHIASDTNEFMQVEGKCRSNRRNGRLQPPEECDRSPGFSLMSLKLYGRPKFLTALRQHHLEFPLPVSHTEDVEAVSPGTSGLRERFFDN